MDEYMVDEPIVATDLQEARARVCGMMLKGLPREEVIMIIAILGSAAFLTEEDEFVTLCQKVQHTVVLEIDGPAWQR